MSEAPSEPLTVARTSAGRALVMGLGSFGGGLGATRFLARRGWTITVTDLRSEDELTESLAGLDGIPLARRLGEHSAEDFERADLVVANPAVAPDHPLLERARARGARITTEIELFLGEVDARVACVTGTQGKSSTCHLLASLLEGSDRAVHLGGNIGGSLLDSLDSIRPDDFVVLELSSYQLEALADEATLDRARRSVEVVAVTNLAPDHLERHGDMESYGEAKRRILELVGERGFALVPMDERRMAEWAPRHGSRLDFSTTADARLSIRAGTFQLDDEELAPVQGLALPGTFQRANALVALGAARLMGIAAGRLRERLPSIRGLDHRLELLGSFAGRRVHDNGVSTTPDSTIAALRSLPTGVHLIAGGRLKTLPIDELARCARDRVARAVSFGEARERLSAAFTAAGVEARSVPTLEEAVHEALAHAPADADVLFSPACSSFDAYPNFRARALAFRAALPARDA